MVTIKQRAVGIDRFDSTFDRLPGECRLLEHRWVVCAGASGEHRESHLKDEGEVEGEASSVEGEVEVEATSVEGKVEAPSMEGEVEVKATSMEGEVEVEAPSMEGEVEVKAPSMEREVEVKISVSVSVRCAVRQRAVA